MKTIVLIILFLSFQFPAFAQKGKNIANKETFQWRYEVEPTGTGTQGTYQIKVWTYSKNAETAVAQAQKNAVHAVIFKGFQGLNGIQGQKPISRDPNLEIDKEDYFKEFFSTGEKYQKYVFLVNNGEILPGDRIKISKTEYKIGVVVSVNISGLRKELENAGIIKKLDSGF